AFLQPVVRGDNATIRRRCTRFKSVKRPVILAVALAGVAGAGWWWARTGVPPPAEWQGYAEADFVKVGPTQQGLLTSVFVARGVKVAAGAPLFEQDDTADKASWTACGSPIVAGSLRDSSRAAGSSSSRSPLVYCTSRCCCCSTSR